MVHVLIVDDDDLVREVGYQMLLKLGHTVQAASNGREALEILRAQPGFSYLFSDVMMPGAMNGVELAKAAAHLRPDLKIILVTGNMDAALMQGVVIHNLVAILPKPYRKQQLVDLIAD